MSHSARRKYTQRVNLAFLAFLSLYLLKYRSEAEGAETWQENRPDIILIFALNRFSNDLYLVRFSPSIDAFFDFLGPAVNRLSYWGEKQHKAIERNKKALDPFNQLFLTLVKLRLNLRVINLAIRFGISRSLISIQIHPPNTVLLLSAVVSMQFRKYLMTQSLRVKDPLQPVVKQETHKPSTTDGLIYALRISQLSGLSPDPATVGVLVQIWQ
jgi:hypothetical protein